MTLNQIDGDLPLNPRRPALPRFPNAVDSSLLLSRAGSCRVGPLSLGNTKDWERIAGPPGRPRNVEALYLVSNSLNQMKGQDSPSTSSTDPSRSESSVCKRAR